VFLEKKILQFLIDSLSVEDLEIILKEKKGVKKPKPMSKDEITKIQMREQIIKLGILYPPKKKF